MALKFSKFTVKEVIRETPEAVSIVFGKPTEGWNYLSGQYLTFRIDSEGKHLNRAFSLSSCPLTDDYLAVTVKETPGGKVSPLVVRQMKVGDEVELMPPLGHFTYQPDPAKARILLLIGAGSGITPLMSILQAALHGEPQSSVVLIYGNRREDCIIFYDKLKSIEARFSDRFQVIHVLSQAGDTWAGRRGRVTAEVVEEVAKPLLNANLESYTCGPSGMMEVAVKVLRSLNIPDARIHQEHFSAPITTASEDDVIVGTTPAVKDPNDGKVVARDVRIILNGEEFTVQVGPKDSVLEAALDAELDPPYACMMGSCCTCKARLVSGKVIMDDREGLTDNEIRDGFVLTCQSHPITEGVLLNYDDQL